ncbi:MAG: alpha/beta hydrolase [Pirellulales bacterium]|nr:alpha/beta hydrolase [Pirellulales bacterium]
MRAGAPPWLLLAGLAGLFCGCAGISPPSPLKSPLARIEDSLIFQPTRYPGGDWRPAGLAFEDAWFAAEDGTRLHGWYCPNRNARAAVLFLHGNAGNITHRADAVRLLQERLGVSVLVFDYRGFGRSEGSPDQEGVLQDARAARAWLASREGVAEQDIVLLGRSLGGGIAVELAAADGARGLILQSTFTSLRDVAASIPAAAPWSLVMRSRLDSLSRISQYHGPLLQSHGDADRLIPYRQGLALFHAANEPKQFVTIPGGDHNDPQSVEYYHVLDQFLTQLPPLGGHAR